MKLKIFCEQNKRTKHWRFIIRDERGRKLGDFGDLPAANDRALAMLGAHARGE